MVFNFSAGMEDEIKVKIRGRIRIKLPLHALRKREAFISMMTIQI